MTTILFRLLSLGALAAGLVLAASAAEKPQAKEANSTNEASSLPQTEDPAQANAKLMGLAFQLRDLGWGEQTKQGWKNVSIESLITAARLLKEMPRPGKLDSDKIEAGKEKDAPETTDTTLPEAQAFDPVVESNDILKRARQLVQETVTDPKKTAAYETLIADAEQLQGTRAVAGGPKCLRRTIKPGQWHTYSWAWQDRQPGVVAFRSTFPMQLQVTRDDDYNPYYDTTTMGGSYPFVVGGRYGKPGKMVRFTVRVINHARIPGQYILAAQ